MEGSLLGNFSPFAGGRYDVLTQLRSFSVLFAFFLGSFSFFRKDGKREQRRRSNSETCQTVNKGKGAASHKKELKGAGAPRKKELKGAGAPLKVHFVHANGLRR